VWFCGEILQDKDSYSFKKKLMQIKYINVHIKNWKINVEEQKSLPLELLPIHRALSEMMSSTGPARVCVSKAVPSSSRPFRNKLTLVACIYGFIRKKKNERHVIQYWNILLEIVFPNVVYLYVSMADDCGYSSQKTAFHHIHICMFFRSLFLLKKGAWK